MLQDQAIQKWINEKLLTEKKNSTHVSSGKLSASMLFQPTRYQLLKTLGVPQVEKDAYTLGLFKRGEQVEAWYVQQMREMGVLVEGSDQKDVEYMGCVGKTDSIINTNLTELEIGLVPNEIKSVKNAKLAMINKTGVDIHYQLQACLYALALGSAHYAVTIISAEDLRSNMWVFDTDSMKDEVIKIIKEYDHALKEWNENMRLPILEARPYAKWAVNKSYSMFGEEWDSNQKVIQYVKGKNANK